MQTSSVEGEPDALQLIPFFLILSICFASCHKPSASIAKARIDTTSVAPKIPLADPAKKKRHKKKKLYITFDDGPNKGTKNVLDIVQDENIPVSFFIVGVHAFASISQQQMWDSLQMAEHIAICNHSFSHANLRYQKYYQEPDSVVKDFERTRDSLHLNNPIARTPGRNIWRIDSIHYTDIKSSVAAADSLASAGFILMGWDVEWYYDHKTMTAKQTADELVTEIDSAFAKKQTKKEEHLVLLAHDQVYAKPGDSMKLRQFLQKLKLKDDYEISLVTSYPGALPKAKADSFGVRGISQ